jgi:hypothetical protein
VGGFVVQVGDGGAAEVADEAVPEGTGEGELPGEGAAVLAGVRDGAVRVLVREARVGEDRVEGGAVVSVEDGVLLG